jgi:hypothetical protein
MKFKKILFFIGFIFLTKEIFPSSCEDSRCNTPCSISKNFWYPRAFSSYQYHDLFQMKHTHESKKRGGKLNLSCITEYMQNFGGKCKSCKNLGSMPFWSGTNQLTIGNNNGKADLDAYQLGLGNIETNENGIGGIIQLNPFVQSIGADMMMYWTQHCHKPGVYFRIHAPIGGIRINPNLTDVKPIQPDNNITFTQVPLGGGQPFQYVFSSYPDPEVRYQTVPEAFSGGNICGDVLNGITGKRAVLHYGRIAPDTQSIIRLTDIAVTLGYNVYEDEKGWAGAGFKVSFPTGNIPLAVYMLEPIYGRGGLWGVGGEVSAFYKIWENEIGNQHLTFSLQGEVEHLMHGRRPSMRSFDLKLNGPGSKYMLVQQYNSNYRFGTDVLDRLPSYLTPAVNITTLPVYSNFSVEGAIAIMLDYERNDWNIALGGEFWGRSREKLSIDMGSALDKGYENLNDFAVVGRQVSSYTISNNSPNTLINTYYCEPRATINESQDPVILAGTYPGNLSAPTSVPEGIKDARLAENRIPAKLDEALDIFGAQVSHVFTGKIFGHCGYNWKDDNYSPSVALVYGAEFTNTTNNVIQLWSLGIQGSLNF